MRFDGFGEHAVDFYEGMAADNSKAYWSDHKAVYDDQIHAPMLALLDELQPEFGTGKIFRPYRDVRFSSDKSPYKTHCGAVIQVTGVAFYTQLGADGLIVAGGAYHWSADQLARYRMAVDAAAKTCDVCWQRCPAAAPGCSVVVTCCARGPGVARPITRGWTCCGTARCTSGGPGRRMRCYTSVPAWIGSGTAGGSPGH